MRVPATLLVLSFAACGGGGGGDDDGGRDGGTPDADIPDPPQCLDSRDALYAYNFLHGNATLRANGFTINAGAQAFTAPDPWGTYVNSDVATIELEWGVNGTTPMRLYIYFATDGVDWWADEVRTYDGNADTPDWIYYTGEMFRCPVGKHYSGDLTLTGDASNAIAGSITFQDIWLRAYVSSEPPGVQMPVVEAMVRPYCEYALACGYPYSMNTCIHNLGRTARAFRPDVYRTATECQTALPDCNDEAAHLACWQDNRPASLPYHDAFRTQCEQHTTACSGSVDPDCSAIAVGYWTDLVYYSEEFVSAIYTCVAPGTPCGGIGFCMDQAASPYGLDL